MREKISSHNENEILYSQEHFSLLQNIRNNALQVVKPLAIEGINSLTYGSVARGDIHPQSDIDIVISRTISSFRIQMILENASIRILGKRIVQATPNDVIKLHFELESDICLTMPLTRFSPLNLEFYRFGGAVSLEQLQNQIRVPGVDKRLMIIQPTEKGHHEFSLVDMQTEAHEILGISSDIIKQRIRVLTRRDKIGRTGIFLNQPLLPEEDAEESLRQIASTNRYVRKRIQSG